MTIHRCGIHHAPRINNHDPAGLGIPFSPFYEIKPDTFEYQTKKTETSSESESETKTESETESKTESEGFTFGKAVGSFGEGILAPFKEMLKHPLKTLGIAAGLGYAIRKVPGLGKVAGAVGLLVGGLQFLSGLGKAATGYFDGDTEKAQEGCKDMGTGTVSTVLSAVNFKTAKPGVASTASKDAELSLLTRVKNFFGVNSSKKIDFNTAAKEAVSETRKSLFTGARYEMPVTPYLGTKLESSGESGESSSESGEEEPLTFRMADATFKKLSPELE